jgi:uncharacterized membrane protein
MSRSKKFYKILQKLDKKEGSVFDIERNLIERGTFHYIKNNLYIESLKIPNKAIRNMDYNFNGRGLVFIGANYNLEGTVNSDR